MSEIIYLEDIVKELSSELKIPENEIDELCRSSIKFSHKLMEDPNVISIVYYNLGTLHFNAYSAVSIYKKKNNYRNFIEVIASKLSIIEREYLLNKCLVHKRRSLYSKFKKFFYPDRKKRVEAKRTQVLKLIEKKQNKV